MQVQRERDHHACAEMVPYVKVVSSTVRHVHRKTLLHMRRPVLERGEGEGGTHGKLLVCNRVYSLWQDALRSYDAAETAGKGADGQVKSSQKITSAGVSSYYYYYYDDNDGNDYDEFPYSIRSVNQYSLGLPVVRMRLTAACFFACTSWTGFGTAMAPAGDVDGDGVNDLYVGAGNDFDGRYYFANEDGSPSFLDSLLGDW